MKFKPMAFSGPMILALLNTRPNTWPPEPIDPSKPCKGVTRRIMKEQPPDGWGGVSCLAALAKHAPFQPGDGIWCREALYCSFERSAYYRADNYFALPSGSWRWQNSGIPPRFMPKEACRLWLGCQKSEPVQVGAITDGDALIEGFKSVGDFMDYFWSLGKDRKPNDATWVWRYEIPRIEKPEEWK